MGCLEESELASLQRLQICGSPTAATDLWSLHRSEGTSDGLPAYDDCADEEGGRYCREQGPYRHEPRGARTPYASALASPAGSSSCGTPFRHARVASEEPGA